MSMQMDRRCSTNSHWNLFSEYKDYSISGVGVGDCGVYVGYKDNKVNNVCVLWLLPNYHCKSAPRLACSGLLHYKPRNTNLWQYPLVVSSISYAPRERKGKRWLE